MTVRMKLFKTCGNLGLYIGDNGEFYVRDRNTKKLIEKLTKTVQCNVAKVTFRCSCLYQTYICKDEVAKMWLKTNLKDYCVTTISDDPKDTSISNLKVVSRDEILELQGKASKYEIRDLEDNVLFVGYPTKCAEFLDETVRQFKSVCKKTRTSPKAKHKGKYRIFELDEKGRVIQW